MSGIQKLGLSCLTFLFAVGLISGQVNADQYRTYQIGSDLKPGKYIVTSKNGTGDLYNSTYDFDFAITNGKRKVSGVHKAEHLNVQAGQRIIVNNFDADFQPDNLPKIVQQGKVSYGEYRVGNDTGADIQPGMYVIKPGKCAGEYAVNSPLIGGSSVSLSGLKKIQSNEHRQHRVQLKDGDHLYVNIQDATLTKVTDDD